MKTKPFTEAYFKKVHGWYSAEQISFSRMSELINDKTIEYSQQQLASKEEEIGKLKKELEEANSMLRYIQHSVNCKIINYLTKPNNHDKR